MPDTKKWGTKSWGCHHTGPDASDDSGVIRCPQDGEMHTLDEAIALNERDAEFARARAWARHKEWVQG